MNIKSFTVIALVLSAIAYVVYGILTILIFFPHFGEGTPFCHVTSPLLRRSPTAAEPPTRRSPTAAEPPTPNKFTDEQVVQHFRIKSFLPTWGGILLLSHFLFKGLKFCYSYRFTDILEGYLDGPINRTRGLGWLLLLLSGCFFAVAGICGIGLSKLNGRCANSLLLLYEFLVIHSGFLFLGTGIALLWIIGIQGKPQEPVMKKNEAEDKDKDEDKNDRRVPATTGQENA